MASDFKLTRPVEFHETDTAGIVHFSNFFRYMEACETAFFRALGLVPFSSQPENLYGWPRVRARCDYHAPLRFGDTVEIHLYVKEIRTRSITYFFRFRKVGPPGVKPEPVARGEITAVCATLDRTTGQIVSRPILPGILAKLREAPKSTWAR
ncbi:MAG: thioesterase family protein [Opitutaceae bacterium]|nr:thioesterase family protein [Opitutaceae bacterium]